MILLKSEREIEAMARSGAAAAAVRDLLRQRISVGVTGRDLEAVAEEKIRELGGTPSFKGYHGYPAAICVSINDEVVHGIPNGRKFRPGDVISVDLGVHLDGYHGDTAFTAVLPPVPDELRQLVEVTERSLQEGIAMARPGNRVHDISAAVEATVRPFGYGIVRQLVGHGIGRDLHEEPQVPNYGKAGTGDLLRKGMVVAIEPMINLGKAAVRTKRDRWTVVTADGTASAHFEHTVAVDDPPRILTIGVDHG